MKLNVLVINTDIIKGENLEAVIQIAKNDYECLRLPSSNHYILCAVLDEYVDDILTDLEDLNLSNPAFEITSREINSQIELEALSLILQMEPR
ncbi:MAG: hypothetical protein AAGC65_07810 [Mucilaginibacter sp.]|uniref:hypothetical protein n=1 Tax=Mucilaginibacter sp. TaxID=1882438 RepID=UPI0031A3E392